MKLLFVLLVCISFSSLNAQWTQLDSPIQTNWHCVQVVDSLISYVGGNGGKVYKTTDGGQTWLDRSPQSSIDWWCMSFVDENYGWVGGRQGTVARTTNGGSSWEINSVYSSAFTNVIESMYFYDNNIGYITGGIYSDFDRQTYIYKTTDGGQSWNQQILLFGGVLLEMSFIDQYIGYCVGTNGGVYKTLNGGITWNPSFVNTGYWLRSVFFTGERDGVALGQSGVAWKTTNGGTTWYQVSTSASNWIESVYYIDQDIAWAVGGGGLCIATINGGDYWMNFALPTNSYLWGIDFNGLYGMVVGDNGIIFRNENGSLVTPVDLVSFTANVYENTVMLSWTTASEINNLGFEVERTFMGLRESVEDENWVKIGFVSGSGTSTESNSYSYSDGNLASGLYMYRLKQIDYDGEYEYSVTTEVEIGQVINFNLEQNYPNPFNPTSKIRFDLPLSGHVSLVVYNSLGEIVSEIINSNMHAGNHEIEFDGVNLPSGVYFYKLVSGDFVSIKKMNLIK